MIAVRGGHGVSVFGKGNGNGGYGATAGGSVAFGVEFVVAPEVG